MNTRRRYPSAHNESYSAIPRYANTPATIASSCQLPKGLPVGPERAADNGKTGMKRWISSSTKSAQPPAHTIYTANGASSRSLENSSVASVSAENAKNAATSVSCSTPVPTSESAVKPVTAAERRYASGTRSAHMRAMLIGKRNEPEQNRAYIHDTPATNKSTEANRILLCDTVIHATGKKNTGSSAHSASIE